MILFLTRKSSCGKLQEAYCPRHNLSKGGGYLPMAVGGGGTYLGRWYLPWGEPTLGYPPLSWPGWGVPTLDWLYLPWGNPPSWPDWGVPTLAGGIYLGQGEPTLGYPPLYWPGWGVPTWKGGPYLGIPPPSCVQTDWCLWKHYLPVVQRMRAEKLRMCHLLSTESPPVESLRGVPDQRRSLAYWS